MIKAIIIDDESDARYVLRNLILKSSASITIVAEADGVEEGVKAIEEHQPDVVFLDIQMRTGNAFDLLEQLAETNFALVFVTAYNQYAIDAFKFSAFAYLLKPVRIKELKEVIYRLEKHLEILKHGVNQRLKILVENYGKQGEIEKLIIAKTNGFQVVKINDIIRLEGDRNYTHFIVVGGQKITASKNLGEFEDILMDYGFFRIHQSSMISLRHVIGYQKGDGGYVEMTDGKELKVSRYRKNDFLNKFE